jgi:hypothetical protein
MFKSLFKYTLLGILLLGGITVYSVYKVDKVGIIETKIEEINNNTDFNIEYNSISSNSFNRYTMGKVIVSYLGSKLFKTDKVEVNFFEMKLTANGIKNNYEKETPIYFKNITELEIDFNFSETNQVELTSNNNKCNYDIKTKEISCEKYNKEINKLFQKLGNIKK